MKTFKSITDVEQFRGHTAYAPLHATVEPLFQSIIADCPDYCPEDDGYLVLLEPDDVDRVLDDLDMPYRLSEVPLNDSAIDVLHNQDTEDEFEYVFINMQTRKPYTTIQKVWSRLRKAADLEHVRIHDLRHQYASMLVNSGRTLYEVQQILGHSTSKVTQRYSHLSTATLQSASSCAADVIKDAMKKSA